ncbi:MAG: GNAT family N-acetyltransferase [bacterium]
MNNKNTYKLFDDYSIEIAPDAKEFSEYFSKNKSLVFSNSQFVPTSEILTDIEQEKIEILHKNFHKPYRLRLYILKGEERIGWFFGKQSDYETFYMTNTGIFKEHRNKGIYKKMLQVILDILKEQGFQKVSSRHSVTNNNIIVPKLKAGFVISGLEVSDVFGMLVHLTYYYNKVRRKLVDYRIGHIVADEEITRILQLPKK